MRTARALDLQTNATRRVRHASRPSTIQVSEADSMELDDMHFDRDTDGHSAEDLSGKKYKNCFWIIRLKRDT
jgi:hypothetical protein